MAFFGGYVGSLSVSREGIESSRNYDLVREMLLQMRDLGLTAHQEFRIAAWLSAEGTLDPPYGGSGAIFWERTLRCAGAR